MLMIQLPNLTRVHSAFARRGTETWFVYLFFVFLSSYLLWWTQASPGARNRFAKAGQAGSQLLWWNDFSKEHVPSQDTQPLTAGEHLICWFSLRWPCFSSVKLSWPEKDLFSHILFTWLGVELDCSPCVILDACFETRAWTFPLCMGSIGCFPFLIEAVPELHDMYKASSLVPGSQQLPNCFGLGFSGSKPETRSKELGEVRQGRAGSQQRGAMKPAPTMSSCSSILQDS